MNKVSKNENKKNLLVNKNVPRKHSKHENLHPEKGPGIFCLAKIFTPWCAGKIT